MKIVIRLAEVVILLLFVPIHFANAQVRFVDGETKLPVPSVNVFSIRGNLIGFSSKDGVLELIPELKKVAVYPLEISVQHVSYESKSLKVAENKNEQVIFLKPRANQLKEVVVSIKPTAEFLRIRGYYRSLETFNLKHKYYSDGIVEFYVPLKKGKVKYRLVDYRIYRDSAVVNDYKQKMWTFFHTPRITEIFAGKLMDRLADYTLRKVADENIKILKNGSEVGQVVSTNTNKSVRFYLDYILPDTVKLEKVLSIEAKVRHDVYIETYSQSPLQDISPKDLLNVYQLVTGSIKRKAEYGHIPYEVLNEFYVMDRDFLSSKEYKIVEPTLIKDYEKTMDKSTFSRPFWQDFSDFNIPPINAGLAAQLGHNLKMVE